MAAIRIDRKDNAESLGDAAAITPNDTDELGYETRAVYVGVTGNLVVVMADQADGTTVTFSNVPVGWHPLRVRAVKTSSTASSLVGAW